jgi:hypothetical protein
VTWAERRAWVAEQWSTPHVVQVRTWGRRLFLAGIVSYLVYQLTTEIGWREIADSIPTHPGFYAIFLVLYYMLPLTESLVYRLSWGTSWWASLPVFVKKRVYNKNVMGYSGEVYLFGWAKSTLGLGARRALSIIKDNALVSSAASTAFALSLLSLFVAAGDLAPLGISQGDGVQYLAVALGVVAVVLVAAVAFRGRLFTLPARILAGAFALYFGRLVIMNALQMLQWSLVIPGVSWQTWTVFLAAQVVISRIPLLPGNDLIFMTTSMELAGALGIPVDALLAMFVVTSAADRALNLVMFGLVSWLAPAPPLDEARDELPSADPPAPADPRAPTRATVTE